jgi:hypothetical protein
VTIPKDQIVSFLRSKGKDDLADQAERLLPDQVDPEQHQEQLNKLGVNVPDLLGHLVGGNEDGPLGGLGNLIGR